MDKEAVQRFWNHHPGLEDVMRQQCGNLQLEFRYEDVQSIRRDDVDAITLGKTMKAGDCVIEVTPTLRECTRVFVLGEWCRQLEICEWVPDQDNPDETLLDAIRKHDSCYPPTTNAVVEITTEYRVSWVQGKPIQATHHWVSVLEVTHILLMSLAGVDVSPSS